VLGGLAPARVLGANDRIRVGVLGTGGRAQPLMKLSKTVPSVELAAVCDVYAPHRKQALEIAGLDAQSCGDYHQVLDRKDIDAVSVGSSGHWHKQMLLCGMADVPVVSLQGTDYELPLQVGYGLVPQPTFQFEKLLVAPGNLAFFEERLPGMERSGQMVKLDSLSVARDGG
jgi:hypothetical protein